MYPSKPGLVIGFHGCEESLRDDIVSGSKMLKASQNGHDWLGTGFYFWENNFDRALNFAKYPPGKKKIQKPAVLGAVIDLQFCLDLMDQEYIMLVKESYEILRISAQMVDKTLPMNRAAGGSKDLLIRELDCAVIENLHIRRRQNNLRPFDSVKGVFVEGDPLYTGAGFYNKTHIQICIRNPNCIKGFFCPVQSAYGLSLSGQRSHSSHFLHETFTILL